VEVSGGCANSLPGRHSMAMPMISFEIFMIYGFGIKKY